MSQIEFEGDNRAPLRYSSHRIIGEPQVPGFTNVLLKIGITKSQKSAFHLLVGTAIGALILAAIILYVTYGKGQPRATPYSAMTPSQIAQIPAQERAYINRQLKKNSQ